MKGEISYDLVMEGNMQFVEGSFRLEGGEWQVFIFRCDVVEDLALSSERWDSGVTGVFVRLPHHIPLNKQTVERVLADRFGVEEWIEVRGPDSIELR